MDNEKDFFKTCFNTVAGLKVKNESQGIAKEVILNEIKQLQQDNKQLKAQIEEYQKALDEVMSEKIDIENNWNRLKECLKDVMNSCDADDKDFVETILDIIQEVEQRSDYNE